ncbi:MAG: hypothetical protein J6X28_04120 [Bacilli bacterium]|nr:hypothetical protein [Bacilli bacterium]
MKKKKIGALVCALAVILYFAFLLAIFISTGIFSKDIPMPFFIFIIIMLCIPLVGIIVSLVLRMKEIDSGEEEEAKKY